MGERTGVIAAHRDAVAFEFERKPPRHATSPDVRYLMVVAVGLTASPDWPR
jgi:hypothetical protein